MIRLRRQNYIHLSTKIMPILLLCFPITSYSAGAWSVATVSCAKVLSQNDLVDRLSRAEQDRIADLHQEIRQKNGYGYLQNGSSKLHRSIPLTETHYPISSWRVDRLHLADGGDYVLVNGGFANMRADWEESKRLLLNHLLGPEFLTPIKLTFEGPKAQATDALYKWRWGFHDAVINTYQARTRKAGYLNGSGPALIRLMWENHQHNISDVFGIIRAPRKPLLDLSQKEVELLTEATIQLTYAVHDQPQILEKPQLADFSKQDGQVGADFWLPFIERFRMPPVDYSPSASSSKFIQIDVSEVRQKLWHDFAGKSMAELNRFSRTSGASGPATLVAPLILKAITTAEQKGVQILFASADSATRRLFERSYHFSMYREIPREIFTVEGQSTGRFSEPEYLLYIEIGSENYKKLVNDLVRDSAGLSVETVPFN